MSATSTDFELPLTALSLAVHVASHTEGGLPDAFDEELVLELCRAGMLADEWATMRELKMHRAILSLRLLEGVSPWKGTQHARVQRATSPSSRRLERWWPRSSASRRVDISRVASSSSALACASPRARRRPSSSSTVGCVRACEPMLQLSSILPHLARLVMSCDADALALVPLLVALPDYKAEWFVVTPM